MEEDFDKKNVGFNYKKSIWSDFLQQNRPKFIMIDMESIFQLAFFLLMWLTPFIYDQLQNYNCFGDKPPITWFISLIYLLRRYQRSIINIRKLTNALVRI